MHLSEELLEKAKLVKTSDELITLVKANSIDLSDEDAKTYFTKLNAKKGELRDDELCDVAGGRKCGTMYTIDGHPIVNTSTPVNTGKIKTHMKKFPKVESERNV